jgi:2-methylcitrate dehydratase PrpD
MELNVNAPVEIRQLAVDVHCHGRRVPTALWVPSGAARGPDPRHAPVRIFAYAIFSSAMLQAAEGARDRSRPPPRLLESRLRSGVWQRRDDRRVATLPRSHRQSHAQLLRAADLGFSSRLFNAEGSDFNPDYLSENLGTRFELPLVAYKRFPVGGPTQPVVQAMLELAPRMKREEISRIEIEMPGAANAFAHARMPALNLPYLCSVILIDGTLSFEMADSLARKADDREVQQLMTRVSVTHDPAQEAVPRKESARVTIRLFDGRSESVFVEHVKGYPANPLSHEDVEQKARELIAPVLGRDRTDALIDLVWRIDDLSDAGVLAAAMSTS